MKYVLGFNISASKAHEHFNLVTIQLQESNKGSNGRKITGPRWFE